MNIYIYCFLIEYFVKTKAFAVRACGFGLKNIAGSDRTAHIRINSRSVGLKNYVWISWTRSFNCCERKIDRL